MTNLYKPFYLLLLCVAIFSTEIHGQNAHSDIVGEFIGDSIDWVDTEGVDYEDFKEITGFGDLHSDNCEEPNVDINIGYYKRLFDVKINFYEELNCKKCQTEAMYEVIYEFLRKGFSFDYIKKKLGQQDFLKLVCSDDDKLFSIQWNQGGVNRMHYVFVHQVADGVYHVQNKRLYYSKNFENGNSSGSIDKIQRIKDSGRYVVFIADFETKSVRLLGVSILDNVLKKEYMFGDKANFLDIALDEQFADRNKLVNLEGLQLIYPVVEDNNVCDGFLFYNGFCFVDIESYNKNISDIETKDKKKLGRKYKLLSKSSDWVEEPCSKVGLDFVFDHYTCLKYENNDAVKYGLAKSDLCPSLLDLEEYNVDSISLYLPIFKGRVSVDGVSSSILKEQLLSHYAPKKNSSPQPIYTAGYDEAFSFEKVKYTTLLFDKEIKQKESDKVQWAVVVDDKIQYLDKKKYRGMQITLEMNPKWEGKIIKVIPFINKIDTHFYCETEVVSR